jgi:hypothetical protein
MKRYIFSFTFLSLIIFYFAYSPHTLAQSKVESDNYTIQFPNLNSGAGVPISTNYGVSSTIGGTATGLYSSTGFRVRSGFQYIKTIIPFSFSVSDIAINFGTLALGVGTTDASTLTVKAGGAGGYSVTATENHPMQNDALSEIPDTTCDNGNCSQTQAEIWTQNTTYGLGFNMSGDDIPADFVDATYFRQFANSSIPENPAVIMSKTQVTYDYPNNAWPWESIANITYKLNVGSGIAGGTYRNIVYFTAIPSF